eukprot:4624888-Pleurochrysis_carterae.AAC.1
MSTDACLRGSSFVPCSRPLRIKSWKCSIVISRTLQIMQPCDELELGSRAHSLRQRRLFDETQELESKQLLKDAERERCIQQQVTSATRKGASYDSTCRTRAFERMHVRWDELERALTIRTAAADILCEALAIRACEQGQACLSALEVRRRLE